MKKVPCIMNHIRYLLPALFLLTVTGCRKDLCYNHDEHSIAVKTEVTADWEQEWQRNYRFDWEELWPDEWPRDYEEFLPEEGSGIRAMIYTDDQVATGNLDMAARLRGVPARRGQRHPRHDLYRRPGGHR